MSRNVEVDRTGGAPPPAALPAGLPRPLELGIALGLLAVATPLLALAGIAIRTTSSGPILFRQTRVGRGGRPFVLLKLRTMTSAASGSSLTSARDPRITACGRILRRAKLDELPQLWNVLRGDMALVGPRPEVPEFVDLESARWRRVLSARPGITDPVSIRLRDESRWIEALGGDAEEAYRRRLLPWKLDGYLTYLDQRSAWRDLVVLWQTLLTVVFSVGEEVSVAALTERGNETTSDPHEEA